jgi:peptidoglycan/LPS O-acetylase OafA/YrhL
MPLDVFARRSWWTPLSHAEYLSTDRFTGLTGLRALAAVAVVCFHYGGPNLDRLQGWIAVQLFFVLSGFLITTLTLRTEARTGRIAIGTFYLRRIFRIMPVYYVVLGLTALFSVIGGVYESTRLGDAMPLYLVFGNELVDYNTPYGMSWTLGVEEKFYLVWPALLLLTALAKRGKTLLRTGFCVGVVLFVIFVALPRTPGAGWANLSVHYGSLTVGCLLALLLHHPRGFALVRPLTSAAVAVPIAIGFCVFQLSVKPIETQLGGGWQYVVPLYAAAAAILLVAVLPNGPVQRILASRPLTFVGDRSYALYLSQVLAAAPVSVLLPNGYLKAAATSALALGFACVVHRWVEVPAIRFGRRLASRKSVVPTVRGPWESLGPLSEGKPCPPKPTGS